MEQTDEGPGGMPRLPPLPGACFATDNQQYQAGGGGIRDISKANPSGD